MSSEPPPTTASAPRRLIVGGAGSAATSPSTSRGSGRVSVRGVPSSLRNERERSELTRRGSLMATWLTNPAMNTHAP